MNYMHDKYDHDVNNLLIISSDNTQVLSLKIKYTEHIYMDGLRNKFAIHFYKGICFIIFIL